jgi:hypothetical protein
VRGSSTSAKKGLKSGGGVGAGEVEVGGEWVRVSQAARSDWRVVRWELAAGRR